MNVVFLDTSIRGNVQTTMRNTVLQQKRCCVNLLCMSYTGMHTKHLAAYFITVDWISFSEPH